MNKFYLKEFLSHINVRRNQDLIDDYPLMVPLFLYGTSEKSSPLLAFKTLKNDRWVLMNKAYK